MPALSPDPPQQPAIKAGRWIVLALATVPSLVLPPWLLPRRRQAEKPRNSPCFQIFMSCFLTLCPKCIRKKEFCAKVAEMASVQASIRFVLAMF